MGGLLYDTFDLLFVGDVVRTYVRSLIRSFLSQVGPKQYENKWLNIVVNMFKL